MGIVTCQFYPLPLGVKAKQDRQTRVLQDILNELRRLNDGQTTVVGEITEPERKESGDT